MRKHDFYSIFFTKTLWQSSGATRSDGLVLKDVDRINGNDGGASSDGDQRENPLGWSL